MSSQGPLTTYLLSSTPDALIRATTHPFLAAAGHGTLPKTQLSQWLSQDRLYAQSYIRFVSLLLSKIRLPRRNPTTQSPSLPTPEEKAISVLIDALVNIRTELAFFEQVATDYDLDLTAISPEEGGYAVDVRGSASYITTSAGISTTGSGSCPGFTGGEGKPPRSKTCTDPLSSDDADGSSGSKHGLCLAQGECQVPSGGGENCLPDPLGNGSGRCGAVSGEKLPVGAVNADAGKSGMRGMEEAERGATVFFCANRTTRAYIDMFMSAASGGVTVTEGLAVLWATEVCYLRSWRFAARCMREDGVRDYKNDADGGALREKFIDNWSSSEFEEFVNRIGDVLDAMSGQTKGVEESEIMRGRCLEWWRQIVWLEENFWPNVDQC
ncbi:uncharacterized protein N7515_006558 [Penicillium bovifimosum]|uniref:Thiaminase-2/PQQC domain-containing protein n=1 Tax=Penicillium bovifimosum TaxID=126998 RepID=A0A9W9L0V8_9EURO|nr:uncharacterized protein N7515_006558 [Penicillium bovifimosum]KAJ5130519.1 hypothetical protein N7515_006558 [Penicillium bovifimosum]